MRITNRRSLLAGCVVALLLATGLLTFAQSQAPAAPAGPLPSVDEVLANHLKAIGGRDAHLKLTSRHLRGTAEFGPGAVATLEIFEKAPNKVLFKIEIQGIKIQEGFDGKVAWSVDPQRGVTEKTGTELAEAARDADFYDDLDMRKRYEKLVVRDRTQVEEREAYRLDGTRSDGSSEVLYFEVKTGLLIKKDTKKPGPNGEEDESWIDDYREVDGIKLPFRVRIASQGRTMTMLLAEVKHNVPMEDSVFAKPATP